MTPREGNRWVVPTLTLCGLWLVASVLVVALQQITGAALPGAVAKVVPFIASGWLTSRLVAVSGRRPRLIASIILAVVAAVAWTTFSAVARGASLQTAVALLGASLPVFLVAAAWAYLGMYLGGRTSTVAGPTTIDPELERLERELRDEMARPRRAPSSESPSPPAGGSARDHGDDTSPR